MINKEYIYSMNDEEIKEALKLLSQAIKENKIKYEYSNPMKENCYISSGEYKGVYFPNSSLLIGNDWQVICICKYKHELGVIYEFSEPKKEQLKEKIKKDINILDFTSFEYLLYTYEERQIIEQLKAELKPLYEAIKCIDNIKIQVKKDGKPFANLSKNFEYKTEYGQMKTYISSYGYLELIYIEKNKSFCFNTYEKPTETNLKELLKTISERRINILDYINKYESDIKNIHKINDVIKKINSLANNFSYPTRLKIRELIRIWKRKL